METTRNCLNCGRYRTFGTDSFCYQGSMYYLRLLRYDPRTPDCAGWQPLKKKPK